jgi:hypothetical protein
MEMVNVHPSEKSIFMAGGITGCPDWQSDVRRWLQPGDHVKQSRQNIILVNPRRANFNVNDPGSSQEQIEWEFRHLNMVDYIYFWFPKEGQCAITLFELGWALGANKKIRVGVEPGFHRSLDVYEQMKLRAPWVEIDSTLSQLYSPILY